MKYIYLSLTLIFSLNSFCQNDLLGEWNLYSIEVDGVQLYSTIPNLFQTIVFNDDNSFDGAGCSTAFTGSLVQTSESSFYFTELAFLAMSCIYPIENNLYLNPYFSLLSYFGPEQGFSFYTEGEGMNETLTIINIQGDKAFYGREPLPENLLPGIWYLQTITKNNNVEVNVYQPNFHINFTMNTSMFTDLEFDGFAVCKDYFGDFRLNGPDAILMNQFNFTLNLCQQYGAPFEDSYLNFFSDAQSQSQLLSYVVTGSGDDETLVLTDENGNYLTYGRQPISFPDNQLVNRWYLQYVNINGEQFDNFYNTTSESLKLDLTNVLESPETTFHYDGNSSCNGFVGGYSYDESTLTFENMAVTLADCQGEPRGIYESYYLDHILRSDNTLPSTLNYTLNEPGLNQTLTLNESNGDFAVYGKTAPSTQFFRTWYLTSIESNGSIIEIPDTEMPTINLTSSRSHPIFPGIAMNGQGDCNAFDGDYLMYFNNTNSIKINNFNFESETCSSNYETEYFDILNDDDTNQFSFELLDSNSTLRLTDLAGNKLLYSSQALSVPENTLKNLSIRLKKNPVKEELFLEFNKVFENIFSYQIYSIDGKQIMKSSVLENKLINVEKLNSGLYFLVISSEDNFKQTLKFIKE